MRGITVRRGIRSESYRIVTIVPLVSSVLQRISSSHSATPHPVVESIFDWGGMMNTKHHSVFDGSDSCEKKERIPGSIGWFDSIENRKM